MRGADGYTELMFTMTTLDDFILANPTTRRDWWQRAARTM